MTTHSLVEWDRYLCRLMHAWGSLAITHRSGTKGREEGRETVTCKRDEVGYKYTKEDLSTKKQKNPRKGGMGSKNLRTPQRHRRG